MKRAVFIGLLLAGFATILATLSQTFDADLGWHLRFGQEVLSGHFPYHDTYTWSYQGQAWVNHEWGAEILFWVTYRHFGYIGLLLLVAGTIWTTFIVFSRHFQNRLSSSSVVASWLALSAVSYLFGVRQTIMAPAFFAFLVVSLETLPQKKYYYAWPMLFWAWAAFHGSWIVGFATIAVYCGAQLFDRLVRISWFVPERRWDKMTWLRVLGLTTASLLATLLNPYGLDLWREVGSYFSSTYYHQFISEWLPSYAYPVYWTFLTLVAVTVALVAKGIRDHKLRLSQCLLFLAFLYAAITHRRHAIYFALLATPLLATALENVKIAFAQHFSRRWLIGGAAAVLCLIWRYSPPLLLQTDPWQNTRFLAERRLPVGAARTLAVQPDSAGATIFNEFRWGGYLNWQLPQALVYLDGRGTATWRTSPTTTLYQTYRDIRFGEHGLAALQAAGGADYILLEKQFTGYNTIAPSRLDQLVFGSALSALAATTTPLENDVAQAPDWQLIYEDFYSILYRYDPPPLPTRERAQPRFR